MRYSQEERRRETVVTASALDCAVPEVGLAEVRARPCGGPAAPPGHVLTRHLPIWFLHAPCGAGRVQKTRITTNN